MSEKLIKIIKINNLQYNPQRDPQAYRRTAGEPFRLQAMIVSREIVRVTLSDEQGKTVAQHDLRGSGTFSHELTFAEPGVRIVTLAAKEPGRSESHDLRLDVMAETWKG